VFFIIPLLHAKDVLPADAGSPFNEIFSQLPKPGVLIESDYALDGKLKVKDEIAEVNTTDEILTITVYEETPKPYNIQYTVKTSDAVSAGDVLLVDMYVRCKQSSYLKGLGIISIQYSAEPHKKGKEFMPLIKQIKVDKDWSRILLPFKIIAGFGADSSALKINFGGQGTQKIDLTGIRLFTYKKKVGLNKLPMSTGFSGFKIMNAKQRELLDKPIIPPVPKGRRYRDIVKDKYPEGNVFIGAAVHGRNILKQPYTVTILNREFNYVTPANDFKQSYIHPSPGVWKWELPEMLISYCTKNDQIIRLHGPIAPQCSKWIKEDNRPAEDMENNLQAYMTALSKKYNKTSCVKWMDVVNEIVEADGAWFGPKPGTGSWENPWPKIGFNKNDIPLYIEQAFIYANEHAPNIKQIINNHTISAPAVEKLKKVVIDLRKKGLRVDGIGWQAHVQSGWEKEGDNLKVYDSFIRWCHKNNLEFHITEFQVYMLSRKERNEKKDDGKKGGKRWLLHVSDEELISRFPAQSKTYKVIVETALKYRSSGVIAINFWHLMDSGSMSRDGALWGPRGEPRPAYYVVQKLLEKPPKPLK
jgi:GH35 family endo-1,4-beta-xylanase